MASRRSSLLSRTSNRSDSRSKASRYALRWSRPMSRIAWSPVKARKAANRRSTSSRCLRLTLPFRPWPDSGGLQKPFYGFGEGCRRPALPTRRSDASADLGGHHLPQRIGVKLRPLAAHADDPSAVDFIANRFQAGGAVELQWCARLGRLLAEPDQRSTIRKFPASLPVDLDGGPDQVGHCPIRVRASRFTCQHDPRLGRAGLTFGGCWPRPADSALR